jgi:hypothetical protein
MIYRFIRKWIHSILSGIYCIQYIVTIVISSITQIPIKNFQSAPTASSDKEASETILPDLVQSGRIDVIGQMRKCRVLIVG